MHLPWERILQLIRLKVGLLNYEMGRFSIKIYGMSRSLHQPDE